MYSSVIRIDEMMHRRDPEQLIRTLKRRKVFSRQFAGALLMVIRLRDTMIPVAVATQSDPRIPRKIQL